MLLRRLHQADLRIGEDRDEIRQPARRDHVIGVDDADDLGIRRGPLQRDAQRTGLEAFDLVLAQEDEALAERLAMRLDRLPVIRVRRVVDDDDAFEVRIVQPGHGIERGLQHLRLFLVGRDMDRDLRRVVLRVRRQRRRHHLEQAARLAAERDRGDLLDPRHRDQHQRHQQHDAEAEREGFAPDEVMALPEREHRRRTRRRRHGRRPPSTAASVSVTLIASSGSENSTPEQEREQCELAEVRIGDRCRSTRISAGRRC